MMKTKQMKTKPIEEWGRICKTKLPIINKLKKQAHPITRSYQQVRNRCFIPLFDCKMLTIYSELIEFMTVLFVEIHCWYKKNHELKMSMG